MLRMRLERWGVRERRAKRRTAWSLSLPLLAAAGCYSIEPGAEPTEPPAVEVPSTPPPEPPAAPPPECQLQSDEEHGPGWPFALPEFRGVILPQLLADCASCHAAPGGFGEFKVWTDAAPGNCSYAKTFNNLARFVDLDNPENSAVYAVVSGGDPTHSFQYPAGDPRLTALLEYIEAAARARDEVTGPPAPPPPPASPFDYAVFAEVIQPIIDTADGRGCSTAACHGAPGGIGGFAVSRMPAADSAELRASFAEVTAACDLAAPERSRFLLQSTHRHANGQSAVVTPAEAEVILAWIERAAENAGPLPGEPPPVSPGCAGTEGFDVAVFASEIEPILLGEVDLNDLGDTRVTTGCSRGSCHGQDRTGGALVLKASATSQENLASFTCFVNLTNPVASDILLCPLGASGCSHAPHPGQVIFADGFDKNYQRILSYLYAAKTAATPLDFAFFARRINPIYSDPTALSGGTQNRTCADCHGVSVAGQAAPNGSNFPMIANATDPSRIAFNFSASANFVNFLQPEGSSLLLYPTNEVANLENPFATGLPHPGGAAFALDSRQALDIVTWARGLRPDGEGFLRAWLVAGDYSAAAITDQTAVDEARATPKIFDPSGASQFNNGQWDGLFSEDAEVDLNLAFPRAATAGRVAYAVAYLLNTGSSDLEVELQLTSSNAVKLWAGERPLLQASDATNGVSGLTTVPALRGGVGATRILVKVLQRVEDEDFAFSLLLRDQLGNVLTDRTGELVVKLGPEGGI